MKTTFFFSQRRAYGRMASSPECRQRIAGILRACRQAALSGLAKARRVVCGPVGGHTVDWRSTCETADASLQDEFLRSEQGRQLLAEVFPDPQTFEERFNLKDSA
jgi:hypothetical protein